MINGRRLFAELKRRRFQKLYEASQGHRLGAVGDRSAYLLTPAETLQSDERAGSATGRHYYRWKRTAALGRVRRFDRGVRNDRNRRNSGTQGSRLERPFMPHSGPSAAPSGLAQEGGNQSSDRASIPAQTRREQSCQCEALLRRYGSCSVQSGDQLAANPGRRCES
jgi:hypothetical protein